MRKHIYKGITVVLLACLLCGCQMADGNKGSTENETESLLGTELETESEIVTETEIEPVVTTVTITATGDCSLGALQTHGYSGSFHS